jgi:hypothetical protein
VNISQILTERFSKAFSKRRSGSDQPEIKTSYIWNAGLAIIEFVHEEIAIEPGWDFFMFNFAIHLSCKM